MPVQYEGVRARAPRRARGVRRLRRLAHGRDRDVRARRPPSSCSALLSNDVAKRRGRRRAVQRPVPRGRRRPRRPLHLPARADRYLTVTNAANHEQGPRLVPRHADGFDAEVTDVADRYAMLAVQGPRAREIVQALADAPLPARFTVARAPARWARRRSSAAPATPARTASSCCSTPPTRAALWDELRAPRRRARRAGRARHAAPRGVLPPLRQRPHRGARPDRGRPRLGLQGGHRASSAPTPCAPRARPGPPRSSCPFALTGPGIAAPGQPGRRRRRGDQRARCRRASSVGIGMAYVPRRRAPRPAPSSRSTCAARSARAVVASKPLYRKERARMADASYPDDLLYHAEHDWARIDGDAATFGDHLVRPGRARRGRVLRPARGRHARSRKDEPYAEVESVKAVSDVIAPLSGEIVEVNTALGDTPEAINEDPYGDGWMVKVRLSDPAETGRPAGRAAYAGPEPSQLSRYTATTDADLRGDARGDRRRLARGAVRPPDPRGRAARPRARPAAGAARAGGLRAPARAGRPQHLGRGRDHVPRRRDVRPLRPGGRSTCSWRARSS